MTLHDEIIAILKESSKPLRPKDFADSINQRKSYVKLN